MNKTKLISFLSVVVSVSCISNIIYAALQDNAVIQGAVRKVVRINVAPEITGGLLGYLPIKNNKADLTAKKTSDKVLRILDKTEFFAIVNGERKPTSFADLAPGQIVEAHMSRSETFGLYAAEIIILER
jgi:hypothetical protein